jgi:anti-sigma B factor antagonist
MIPTAMETMEVEREPGRTSDVTVFKLTGPFVLGTMFELQAAFREPAVKGVIIDLSAVPYIDSAGLGVLLGEWSHTQRGGYKYALVGMSPRVHTIFEITHTDSVLPIFQTQAEAEASFAKAAAA